MRSNTCIAALAAVLGGFFLSACGGGGGGGGSGSPGLSDAELERLRSDPRIVRLAGIAGRVDTVVFPSLHLAYSLSGGGATLEDSVVEHFTCGGTRCVGDEGTTITERELIDPDTGVSLTGATLGTRGGFDTVTATSESDLSIPNVNITAFPSVFTYGLWGQHGWAAVEIGDGPMAGRIRGVPVSGNIRWAGAHALGDATRTTPTGTGSATWTGIAEAASTNTFRRHQGTVTVTIADLSTPRIGVDIVIGGSSIGSSAWSDMEPVHGGFGAGTAGTDRVQGNFYGPNHTETYGIFDTDAYVGAFGAKRDP